MKFIKHTALALVLSLGIYLLVPFNNIATTIIIQKGESKLLIAKNLEENGVIYAPQLFWCFAQVSSVFGYIKAGEYEILAYSSPFTILQKFIKGEVVVRKITIPEGYTNQQIYLLVEQAEKLSGKIDRNYQEGEFLPGTYYYVCGDQREDILKRIHQTLQTELQKLWPLRDQSLPIKTIQELMTMASIIEKEAKTDQERPLIASVFYNRLKANMPLQADPTTIYAITKGQYQLNRSLTKNDLKIISPYNTYTSRGLPPTPIANPGLNSIKAALHPAQTDFLYFVQKDENSHNFSANLKQHNQYVANYKTYLRQGTHQ